jgi:hypothetical protein
MSDYVRSYPKIWNMGHPAVTELFMDEVVIEEKVDGSQFSFGVFGGELRCKSKGKDQIPDAPDKMFLQAIASVQERQRFLVDGWTYRGEYLMKPTHNTLSYDRVPVGNICLFDVNTAPHQFLNADDRDAEAKRIGLECIPVYFKGRIETLNDLEEHIKRTSYLGGPQVEGVVVKNYHRYGQDGHPLFGKHVREDFKEQHKEKWGELNPGQADILSALGKRYQAAARWQKAIQRLRDDGRLANEPKDIGALLKEVQRDLNEEIRAEVADALLKWAMPHVLRSSVRGLPEWYKQRLLELQFEQSEETCHE